MLFVKDNFTDTQSDMVTLTFLLDILNYEH